MNESELVAFPKKAKIMQAAKQNSKISRIELLTLLPTANRYKRAPQNIDASYAFYLQSFMNRLPIWFPIWHTEKKCLSWFEQSILHCINIFFYSCHIHQKWCATCVAVYALISKLWFAFISASIRTNSHAKYRKKISLIKNSQSNGSTHILHCGFKI